MENRMSVFFFENQGIITIESPDLEKLKRAAATAPLRRARYCLHHSHDDDVQEMVIAFCQNSSVPVHRHSNKSESYHVIEGELKILFFDNEGNVTRTIHMGQIDSGLPFMYRLSVNEWHTIRPLSEFVVLHEITSGPFVKEENEILDMSGEE